MSGPCQYPFLQNMLLRAWQESVVRCRCRQLHELRLAQAETVGRQGILLCQAGAKHAAIICIGIHGGVR